MEHFVEKVGQAIAGDAAVGQDEADVAVRPLQRAIYLNSDADPAYLLTTSGRELAALGEWHLAEAA
ncbi:MAG TPA: hypothetical protein EYP88_04815, partial [Anaerolineales bacterium]|nr:hypothetical protein [Anaerolineales bacterium]